MLKMDIYDHESYMTSIELLLMLKMLHDEGVNVSNYDNFMVHVHHGNFGECILFDGIKDLFEETYAIASYELEEDIEYKEFRYLSEEPAEYYVVIRDSLFKTLSEDHFNDVIDSFDGKRYEGEVNMDLLKSKDGVVMFIYWLSARGMSDLLEEIIRMKRYAKKLRGEMNGNKHTNDVGTAK